MVNTVTLDEILGRVPWSFHAGEDDVDLGRGVPMLTQVPMLTSVRERATGCQYVALCRKIRGGRRHSALTALAVAVALARKRAPCAAEFFCDY